MLLLRNFESVNEYFDLESNSSHKSNLDECIIGVYNKTEHFTSAIYVMKGKIVFSLNDLKYQIEDSYHVILENLEANKRCFGLYNSNDLVCSFEYEIDKTLFGITPFEYIDEEEFDWGLFIQNIVNDRIRKKEFIRTK